MKMNAAIVGGGVIGGGWAARFLLMGWNVTIFDPAPDAKNKLEAVLGNARRTMPSLYGPNMPSEGRLNWAHSVADAVQDAAWIQESVPERLALKRDTLLAVEAACPQDSIIASSTSGFKPTDLKAGAKWPDRIIVAHPFNPVYLLPLVELVGSKQSITVAESVIRALRMKPLHVRCEIDAHIADRLLEAVWREALWLIKDGVATTAEIDDAIRFGFGLRWAQMGLFETYRIAGGEAGMAHFLRQFGPALQWPWSRLTDVPDLTEDLVSKIASQSDDQSGDFRVCELERIRDDNLVAIMLALKERNWGVGALLTSFERNDTELGHES